MHGVGVRHGVGRRDREQPRDRRWLSGLGPAQSGFSTISLTSCSAGAWEASGETLWFRSSAGPRGGGAQTATLSGTSGLLSSQSLAGRWPTPLQPVSRGPEQPGAVWAQPTAMQVPAPSFTALTVWCIEKQELSSQASLMLGGEGGQRGLVSTMDTWRSSLEMRTG